MADKMRFAIVGAGVIAPFHAKAVALHPDAELVAVADIEKDKAERLSETHGIPLVYTDYEQMLKRDDIDVICAAVPSGLHHEVAIAAAQAGKHVLCEKPLDIASEPMTRMIDACRQSGVKLGCVFQRRVMPASIAAKKAVTEGKLGKLVLGDAYLKYYRSPDYYRSAGWRGTWAMDGAGRRRCIGVRVFGSPASRHRGRGYGGGRAEIQKRGFRRHSGHDFRISGAGNPVRASRREGHDHFRDSGFKQWSFAGSDEEMPEAEGMVNSGSDPANIAGDGHYILVDDMIKAVRENRDPLITGEEARKAVDLILAIYESSRTGKEVVL